MTEQLIGHRPLHRFLLGVLIFTVICSAPQSGSAQQTDSLQVSARQADSLHGSARQVNGHPGNPPSTFLRSSADSSGNPLAVQTAIVRYGWPECTVRCATVDLVATVHVADRAYFERINSLLARYDVVLFEMVLPDSLDLEAGVSFDDVPDQSGVRNLYQRFGGLIGMVSQDRGIDYAAENFVHADLSWETLRRALAERGESMPDFHEFAEGISSLESAADNMDFHTKKSLRKVFAASFLQSQKERREGTLISTMAVASDVRNAHVLKLLSQQLKNGVRRIAVLYGAGHMPDLQDHLMKDFNLQPLKRLWIDAWDLR